MKIQKKALFSSLWCFTFNEKLAEDEWMTEERNKVWESVEEGEKERDEEESREKDKKLKLRVVRKWIIILLMKWIKFHMKNFLFTTVII